MEPLSIGTVTVEVREGRRRYSGSRTTLRCDMAAVHDDTILLLSAIGTQSSLEALVAGLRNKDQDKVTFSVDVDGAGEQNRFCHYRLSAYPNGYRVVRHKLMGDYGLWQVLVVAKHPGLLPVLNDDSLWTLLRGEDYTTPLVREWVPYVREQMVKHGGLVIPQSVGCNPGLMVWDDDKLLDDIVSDGVRDGHLKIDGECGGKGKKLVGFPRDLDGYLTAYGPMMGKQAERSLDPLHVPGRDPLLECELLREPFEAQKHVIAAGVKTLKRQKSLLIVGEMGLGKSLLAMVTAHQHANGQPYRGLVFCPGQLTQKWEREIRETLPGVHVVQIESWKDLLKLDRHEKPTGPEWYVIARDRAKLGACWKPACVQRTHMKGRGFVLCPHCMERQYDDHGMPQGVGTKGKDQKPGTGLWKSRQKCKECSSPLWTMTGELWRYEPALFIKRHLKNFFKYLVLDEIHEEKGAATAQANAAGALIAACRKVIACTGTLIGGYAEHLRPLMFRLSAKSLVDEGFVWNSPIPFNECYGRIETTIREKSGGGGGFDDDNRMSRGSKGSSRTITKHVRPGIMPALFGRHLIDKAVFLSLNEVADNLPSYDEHCISVDMEADVKAEYKEIEEKLKDAIKDMLRRNDRRLLGKMLQTLLAYPDYPYDWEPVGYWDRSAFMTVAIPASFDKEVIQPKERALIDLCKSEKAAKRQVWVYVQYTDAHDVQGRLESLLKAAGLKVGVLRASVKLDRREEWIAKNAPKLDVVISHPRLVETGLDLFDKGGKHNFPTLVFYETGYNLFTLRQASRRSWRIGQKLPCKVYFFSYAETMQERAIALMGKKLSASQALEGKFSSEGLVAMSGEEGSMEMALAKSLVESMDETDMRRTWGKVGVKADAGPGPMSGKELVALMRQHKVKVAEMANALGIAQSKVTAARKVGLQPAERALWADTLLALAATATKAKAG